jgi:predicted DCC family thiol-disulfide oxidoreductase YuxK
MPPLPFTRIQHPPAERPLMIFDGECNFCRHWIHRWQRLTGPRVDYGEFQELAVRFSEIPRASFVGAVHWLELDGRVFRGADAVFRLYDFIGRPPWFVRWFRRVPGFWPIARAAYALVAWQRTFFSWLAGTLPRA